MAHFIIIVKWILVVKEGRVASVPARFEKSAAARWQNERAIGHLDQGPAVNGWRRRAHVAFCADSLVIVRTAQLTGLLIVVLDARVKTLALQQHDFITTLQIHSFQRRRVNVEWDGRRANIVRGQEGGLGRALGAYAVLAHATVVVAALRIAPAVDVVKRIAEPAGVLTRLSDLHPRLDKNLLPYKHAVPVKRIYRYARSECEKVDC